MEPNDGWHDKLARKLIERSINPLIAQPAFLLLWTLGLIIGFVVAFPIRIVATVCFLLPGLRSISRNWWRTLFATDIFTRPEIIPGHAEVRSVFHFDELASDISGRSYNPILEGGELKNKYPMLGKYLRLGHKALFSVGAIVAYMVFLGPSYLYRMSIKSTAWAHWPIAYISRPLRFADDPEEVQMRLWIDPREWLRRLAMVLTLSGAVIASVPTFSSVKAAFPAGALSIVEYAVLIDVRSLFGHPWRVMALISAAITLMLTWYGFELSLLVKRSKAKPNRLVSAGKWASALEYAMRVRDICGWIFWGLVFVHASLWLAPSTSWLKGYPQEILQFIYADYLPPRLS
jgi:hypothetical protein